MQSYTYASLRRTLGQRLNMWGGDSSTAGVGTMTANGDTSHIIDTNRAEPDHEWDDAWIVVNPAGANQALTTTWRRTAARGGWTIGNGTFTLTSPLPSSSYTASGVTYEVYKVFRPEQWLSALNWAMSNSYPARHRRVWFEVPEDSNTEYYDWQQLASLNNIADPGGAPTLSAISGLSPNITNWVAGTYTVGYTFYNATGETKLSPTANLTLVAGQGIRVAAITCPDNTLGVNYYANPNPAGTQAIGFHVGQAALGPTALGSDVKGRVNTSFQVPQLDFYGPPSLSGNQPPVVNSTNFLVTRLLNIQQRKNPNWYPEVVVDLGTDMYEPVGGSAIKLMYRPMGFYSLRFNCMAPVPLFTGGETETTQEPLELIMAGAEFYLWDILLKQSTGQNTIAWDKLVKEAQAKYEKLKMVYMLQPARTSRHRPRITPVW